MNDEMNTVESESTDVAVAEVEVTADQVIQEADAALAELEAQRAALEAQKVEAVKKAIEDAENRLEVLRVESEALQAEKVRLESLIGIEQPKAKGRKGSTKAAASARSGSLAQFTLSALNRSKATVDTLEERVTEAGYESNGVLRNNLNQALHKLRAAGFVDNEPSPEDGRVKIYFITQDGKDHLVELRSQS